MDVRGGGPNRSQHSTAYCSCGYSRRLVVVGLGVAVLKSHSSSMRVLVVAVAVVGLIRHMGSGRNVFQKLLKVVFTWGPATYSLLLAHTAGQ